MTSEELKTRVLHLIVDEESDTILEKVLQLLERRKEEGLPTTDSTEPASED